jgi:hypothetical protein
VMAEKKVPVSMRALVARINRKLRADGEVLKAAHGARAESSVGHWYVLNLDRNQITRRHVDPEDLGRRLGCLQAWEKLVD